MRYEYILALMIIGIFTLVSPSNAAITIDNATQNATRINQSEMISISSDIVDDAYRLDKIWVSTDESGEWNNYTIDYRRPSLALGNTTGGEHSLSPQSCPDNQPVLGFSTTDETINRTYDLTYNDTTVPSGVNSGFTEGACLMYNFTLPNNETSSLDIFLTLLTDNQERKIMFFNRTSEQWDATTYNNAVSTATESYKIHSDYIDAENLTVEVSIRLNSTGTNNRQNLYDVYVGNISWYNSAYAGSASNTTSNINWSWKNESIFNTTVRWQIFANNTNGDIQQSSVMSFDVGTVGPLFNSNQTDPGTISNEDNVSVSVNVTPRSGKNVVWVNFTIYPLGTGTKLAGNANGSLDGNDIWNISIIPNQTGDWVVETHAFDNESESTLLNWTFTVNTAGSNLTIRDLESIETSSSHTIWANYSKNGNSILNASCEALSEIASLSDNLTYNEDNSRYEASVTGPSASENNVEINITCTKAGFDLASLVDTFDVVQAEGGGNTGGSSGGSTISTAKSFELTPTGSTNISVGQGRFRKIEFVIKNVGSADGVYVFEKTGSAAPWITPSRTQVTIAKGQSERFSIDISVPANQALGKYTLTVSGDGVKTDLKYAVNVVEPQDIELIVDQAVQFLAGSKTLLGVVIPQSVLLLATLLLGSGIGWAVKDGGHGKRRSGKSRVFIGIMVFIIAFAGVNVIP